MRTRGFEAVKRFEGKEIVLPQRSTEHSAGYDFFLPEEITIPSNWMFRDEILNPGKDDELKEIFPDTIFKVQPFLIKTGIKAYMLEDEVLELYMRSSNPSKLGIICANSVGIIDSDYYSNPENDGEIGFLVYNMTQADLTIPEGYKIGQGIFKKFLKVDDDCASGKRVGGYGSTC